jgi:hypothetical protein
MSPAVGCPNCGGPAEGVLCRFCGSLLEEAQAPEAQLQALDEYHAAIGRADAEGQKRLLTSGFIPDSPQGLIEAGVMCIPLCKDGNTGVAGAATHRLEAIVLKLELARETGETRKALDRFRRAIQERKDQDRSDTRIGCTVFIVLAAVIVALAAYIIHRFAQ